MNAPKLTILGLALLCLSSQALAQELIPLKQLVLGQSAQDFTNLFPNAKSAFETREAGKLVSCVAFLSVPSNAFWSGAMVRILNSRVASIGYVQTESFERGYSNTPIILRQLIRLEGTNSTRAVARHHARTGMVASPILLWEKPERVLAFSCMPLDIYKQGDPFICQLSIFPRGARLREIFELATLPEADKQQVFRTVDELLQRESPP